MSEDRYKHDADGAPLEVGAFYWVCPVHDADMGDDWFSEWQPARFAGFDADGDPTWNFMGQEGVSDWPLRGLDKRIPFPWPPAG